VRAHRVIAYHPKDYTTTHKRQQQRSRSIFRRASSSNHSDPHRSFRTATLRFSTYRMAPIILATMGEFASQLTQEFGDRDSQILRLETENARLRELEVEKRPFTHS
jgi:hypothetical protein